MQHKTRQHLPKKSKRQRVCSPECACPFQVLPRSLQSPHQQDELKCLRSAELYTSNGPARLVQGSLRRFPGVELSAGWAVP
eukprot:2506771-Amphidinium_carterae.1